MTTLPNMTLVLPTRGSAGAGLWGDTEDANWGKVDAHDHTPGHGPLIPTAGIGINADLPFSALYAPTQLHRVQFSAIAGAALTGSQRKSLFVSDGTGGLVANELYYLTSAGAAIQFTSGSSLNVGAFVAGIGGDYAGVGAQLNYTDSSKTYDFKESTADSHAWARVQCGGIRLIEFNTTETFFVAQIAPAALGASYTVTWPTALPGSTLLQQIDNTGQTIWSNTVPNAIVCSSTVTATEFKHGTMTLQIPTAYAGAGPWHGTMANLTTFGIPLKNGDRILAIRTRIQDSATGPTKFTASLESVADGVASNVATSAQSSGAGTNQTLTISSLTSTIASGTNYQVKFAITTGATNGLVYWIEVDYDRP